MNIQFFEKPGCTNNTKQKLLLEEQGHQVESYSLLTHDWKADELKDYFDGMPVASWFNPSAPRIKSGEVVPDSYDEASAIQAMLNDRLLIRRPLINAEGKLACGFDNKLVNQLLNNIDVSHLQKCPQTSNSCD